MEDLLKKYLQKIADWEDIYIGYYNVDGATCEVTYYTDVDRYYKETININIWDMLLFLNVL